jgi:ribosomal protein S3AE
LSKINDIYYADKYEMKQWYNEMAHTEFTLAEISSSHKTETDILNYIRELIE